MKYKILLTIAAASSLLGLSANAISINDATAGALNGTDVGLIDVLVPGSIANPNPDTLRNSSPRSETDFVRGLLGDTSIQFVDKEEDVDIGRRKALVKLGLMAMVTYTAPLILNISDAHGKGSSGGSGGSGSGSGGGSGGRGGSGGSGASGASGGSGGSGASGASGGTGASGASGTSGASRASGASGASSRRRRRGRGRGRGRGRS